MLKKYINENQIKNVEKNGYLIINGERHLIINIPNQPIEILNANGIYEYIENERPEEREGYYIIFKYKLIDNIIYKTYEYVEIEEDEEEI